MRVLKLGAVIGSALALASCQQAEADAESLAEDKAEEEQIALGNGVRNSITTDGITRAGSVFTVPSVTIERNGWLVMHPFRDGEPVRNEYVGSTLVEAGTTENVEIDVSSDPTAGDMFIIMLHYDVNDDGVFDFGDGETVPDAPAFEDGLLIAHRIAAPEES